MALAAAGRLLAGAEPLGRLAITNRGVSGFLFRARPDGQPREVLVIWSTEPSASVNLPTPPLRLLDHLGRDQKPLAELKLGKAPTFAILPIGTAPNLSLESPPLPSILRTGNPSQIVLQALWPEEKRDLKQSAYRVSADDGDIVPVFAYNFGSIPVRGTFHVHEPSRISVQFPAAVEIAPRDRVELGLKVTSIDRPSGAPTTVRILADFGRAGHSVLSVRLVLASRD